VSKKIAWAVSARKSYLAKLGELIDLEAYNAAQKIDNELVKKLKILSNFPAIGSFTKNRDARKLVLLKHYLLIYTELDDSIIIAAFIDSRSDHPY